MLKEIHFQYDRRNRALRWKWPVTDDMTQLELECLDWLDAGRVVDSTRLEYRDFGMLYMNSGWRPGGVEQGVPVLFRVRERFPDGQPDNCLDLIYQGEGGYPIRWWIGAEPTDEENRLQTITVEYPIGLPLNAYPDRLLCFAVRPLGSPDEQPARMYLPRPDADLLQTYYFDPTQGWQLQLELDDTLPLGSRGLFTTGQIFRLERA